MDLQSIKNRFGIIGNSPALNLALNVAAQVAVTDLSVLIVGESGVGKEAFSQIIHALSARSTTHSLQLTAARYRKERLTPSYSVTKKDLYRGGRQQERIL